MNDDHAEMLWQRRDQLLQRIAISVLYHRRRERFFDGWDRVSKAATIVIGSAAVSKVLGGDALLYIGAAAILPSTFALVFGFGDKARRHSELAARFKNLEAEIARVGEIAFTETQLSDWRASIAEIEAGEPASLIALVRICERQIFAQRGALLLAGKVSLLQRVFAHYYPFAELQKAPKR